MFGRGIVGVGICLISGLIGITGIAGARDRSGDERPVVSKPTPTVEEGMPLFSTDEIAFFFEEFEQPERKAHPIFVGRDDDIVELETFNVYSDKITLQQSLEARMSEAGRQAMVARLDRLDPKLTSQVLYDKRSSERFFSSRNPGATADRPDPGGIHFNDALDSTLKAFRQVFGP
ncbi:MAG: hypothetical protein DRP71_05595 [Verrucomicrobia bacterium]|nr:MAG: hypothetical protein DRP71_05595 [Verrucomicrobiota bacterium]